MFGSKTRVLQVKGQTSMLMTRTDDNLTVNMSENGCADPSFVSIFSLADRPFTSVIRPGS
jgi:hypothetical protein